MWNYSLNAGLCKSPALVNFVVSHLSPHHLHINFPLQPLISISTLTSLCQQLSRHHQLQLPNNLSPQQKLWFPSTLQLSSFPKLLSLPNNPQYKKMFARSLPNFTKRLLAYSSDDNFSFRSKSTLFFQYIRPIAVTKFVTSVFFVRCRRLGV